MSVIQIILLRRRLTIAVLLTCSLLVLILSRLPHLTHNYQLDPDESYSLALSGRFAQDWTPWRAVNTSTSGPFMVGLLTLVSYLKLPMNYVTAHWIALALLLGICVLGWRISRRFVSPVPASLALIAIILWISTSQNPGYSFLATELMPSLFIGLGLLMLVDQGGVCTRTPWKLCLGAFFVGLSPLAKLQVGPVSLFVCLWIAWSLLCTHGPSDKSLKIRIGLLAMAACFTFVPLLLQLLLCFKQGTIDDFWISYYKANMSYAEGKSRHILLQHLLNLFKAPWIQAIAGLMLVLLPLGLARVTSKRLWHREVLCAGLLASSLCAVLFPKYDWCHYNILLFLPVLLSVALLLQLINDSLHTQEASLRYKVFIAFSMATLGTPLLVSGASNYETYRTFLRTPEAYSHYSHSLREKVLPLIPRGSSVLVWGLASSLYVDLQSVPASRHGDFFFLVLPLPEREFLRAGLMEDLNSSKPDWIIAPKPDAWVGICDEASRPFPALQLYLDRYYEKNVIDQTLTLYKLRR